MSPLDSFACMRRNITSKISNGQNFSWKCNDDIKKKDLENIMNIQDVEKRGPLFFKVIMHINTSNTGEAIRTLTSNLSTF